MRAASRRLREGRARGMRAAAFVLAAFSTLLARSARAEEPAPAAKDAPAPRPEPPPRPPLPPRAPAKPVPWSRHVDIGGGVALVNRVAATEAPEGVRTPVRYSPSLGFGLWARWELVRWLRMNLYFVRSQHEAGMPPGALGLPGDPDPAGLYTYSFGARLAPTWQFGPRLRTWVSAGAGWGRIEVDPFDVRQANGGRFDVRSRAASFVELPFGLGASFDLIPKWLALEVEVVGAFNVGERGDALREGQTIDSSGRRVDVGPLPEIQGSFVQTLGLSLVL
jgi:hypothetical protein